jgi:hypothetical protein
MAIDEFSSFEELRDDWAEKQIENFGSVSSQLCEMQRRLDICDTANGRTDDEVRVIKHVLTELMRIVGRLADEANNRL